MKFYFFCLKSTIFIQRNSLAFLNKRIIKLLLINESIYKKCNYNSRKHNFFLFIFAENMKNFQEKCTARKYKMRYHTDKKKNQQSCQSSKSRKFDFSTLSLCEAHIGDSKFAFLLLHIYKHKWRIPQKKEFSFWDNFCVIVYFLRNSPQRRAASDMCSFLVDQNIGRVLCSFCIVLFQTERLNIFLEKFFHFLAKINYQRWAQLEMTVQEVKLAKWLWQKSKLEWNRKIFPFSNFCGIFSLLSLLLGERGIGRNEFKAPPNRISYVMIFKSKLEILVNIEFSNFVS